VELKKPMWARRIDAANFTIIGIILLVCLWEAIARGLGL
jgi:hypothetical protein